MEEFSKSVEGIQEILISVNDEMATRDLKNKGYAFFEFGDHKTAATAKKKLENSKEPVSRRCSTVPLCHFVVHLGIISEYLIIETKLQRNVLLVN